MTVRWNTQLAATMRSEGMVMCVFRNQSPRLSANINTTREIATKIQTAVENMRLSISLSPRPNSKVKKRLTADDKDPKTIVNNPISPPTTLYIPKSSTPKASSTTREV